jgi:RNA polymerase sigma-70 factor (ECF subfamily)
LVIGLILNQGKGQTQQPVKRCTDYFPSAYFDRLYAYVFQSVNRDQMAAEDVVQEVFLSVLKSAKKFKGQSKIYTWLIGIAHHKIIDYFRHKQKVLYLDNKLINDKPDYMLSTAEDYYSISESLESGETGNAIIETLSHLPFNYQQVLLFKYVEEMTVLEISQVMNRSYKSIEGLITRARRLLKESLSVKL